MSGSGLNGKTGETLRYVMSLVLAAIVAYYSAQITTERRITAIETAEESHFAELQRGLARIEADIRDLRLEVRKQ